ncbi:GntR family transcriptional regulator [Rhizobium leguminosarum]|uniref:GntR family transcriptional regulator n=1 Tax=Rhizobium leguminosarum TaxID=384 RepID=UPI0004815AA0|nr:GntR family transcriptional regulator [Rhizobium leguminosarum]WFT90975.1 GntR family transcriptional regulator [Rhizobium leguminosarum]
MSDLPVLEHENLSNTVYATLCDALIKGRFQPGDRLKIRDIAEQLGTSVTPVRDAILRLAHDDAIVFRSPRDIRIPIVTMPHYLEIRSIRLRLEALAAETAAKNASKADIETLTKILADSEKALQEGDRLKGTELNQAFHFQLTAIANLPVLHGILRRLWLQMGPLIADAYLDGGRLMIDFHYPVIAAIRKRDPQAAAHAIMDDIEQGGHSILTRVESHSNTGGFIVEK